MAFNHRSILIIIAVVFASLCYCMDTGATYAKELETFETLPRFLSDKAVLANVSSSNDPNAYCAPCNTQNPPCAGMCCDSPPYYCCIASNGQCYCGCN